MTQIILWLQENYAVLKALYMACTIFVVCFDIAEKLGIFNTIV